MTARFPWPQFRFPWSVEVSGLIVDCKPHDSAVDRLHRRVRLDDLTWQCAGLVLRAQTTERMPAGIDNLQGFVVVSSPRTNVRTPVPLLPDGLQAVYGEVPLDSHDLAGTVALTVTIVATIDGRRRTIADAEDWVVVVDDSTAPTPPGAPPFPHVWVDFACADAPDIARRNHGAHAIMDLSAAPQLLLNAGIEGLQDVLHAEKPKLERRRIRDLLGTTIACDAVTSLFRAAVAEVVDLSEDGPVPPSDSLSRQTCEAVAGAMPTVSSVDELYERIVATKDSARDRATLWAEAEVALAALTDVHDTVVRVAGEVKRA